MRWWDGAQWTEHVAEPDAEAVGARGCHRRTARPPCCQPELGGPRRAATPAAPPCYPGSDGRCVRRRDRAAQVPALDRVGGARRHRPRHRDRRSRCWSRCSSWRAGEQPSTPQPSASRVHRRREQQQAVAAVELYDEAYPDGRLRRVLRVDDRGLPRALRGHRLRRRSRAGGRDFDDRLHGLRGDRDLGRAGRRIDLGDHQRDLHAARIDDDGNETAVPQSYEDVYEYIVVPTDDGWADRRRRTLELTVAESAARPRSARFILTCIGVGLLAGPAVRALRRRRRHGHRAAARADPGVRPAARGRHLARGDRADRDRRRHLVRRARLGRLDPGAHPRRRRGRRRADRHLAAAARLAHRAALGVRRLPGRRDREPVHRDPVARRRAAAHRR